MRISGESSTRARRHHVVPMRGRRTAAWVTVLVCGVLSPVTPGVVAPPSAAQQQSGARVVADVRGGQPGAAPTTTATVNLQVRTKAGTWRRATGWTHRTTGRPAREVDLARVRPGVYRVVVKHRDYRTAITRAFRVRGPGTVTLPRIVLDPGARIVGTYVADGGWSMDHPPQARAYLRVRTEAGKVRWKLVREQRTVALEDDMTDVFTLRGLPPGTYAVCVRVITTGCMDGPTPARSTQVRVVGKGTVEGVVVHRTTL